MILGTQFGLLGEFRIPEVNKPSALFIGRLPVSVSLSQASLFSCGCSVSTAVVWWQLRKRQKEENTKEKHSNFFFRSTQKAMTNLLKWGNTVDAKCCGGEEGGKTTNQPWNHPEKTLRWDVFPPSVAELANKLLTKLQKHFLRKTD